MQIASGIAIPIAICLASQVDVLLAATARAGYDRSTGRTPMTVPASPLATVIPLALLEPLRSRLWSASVGDVPSPSNSFATSGLASNFSSIASILALSAEPRRAIVVILAYLLMRNGTPHTNHQTPSQLRQDQRVDQLIHHSDRGVQYRDSYDNALAEAINSLYKGECIHNVSMHPTSFATLDEAEKATTNWVGWYNNHRLHSALGHTSPVDYETTYWNALSITNVVA